jgi:hypothetical protein
MSEQGFQREVTIEAIARATADELDRRNHALDGKVFLTSASDFGEGVGKSPVGKYSGFVVLSTPTITSITFLEPEKYNFAPTQSIATIDEYYIQGVYYPMDFSFIEISGGVLELIKKP